MWKEILNYNYKIETSRNTKLVDMWNKADQIMDEDFSGEVLSKQNTKSQRIMCTIDTRDWVSIDTSNRHLAGPSVDPRWTLDWHMVDISVDRLSIFILFDTLWSGDRY